MEHIYETITIIWIICISICNGNDPSKLYGGTQVELAKHPYVVSLQWREKHHCGGSIITLDTIITSASCVVIDTVPLIYQSNLKVLIGADNNVIHHGDGVLHSVRLIIAHENYDPSDSWIHDLALLKLETPITPFSDKFKMIKLPTITIRVTRLSTVGWGGTNQLQKIFIKSNAIFECNDIFTMANIRFYKSSKGCATPMEPGTNIVLGDGGNPLIQGNFIVGVISVFNPIYPATVIFTKIYPYRHWIKIITDIY